MLYLVIPLFIFNTIGLSILTDGKFTDLLDNIGDHYKIPTNMVAASLMAMASSAPEFSASLVDTFWFKNHIGIGTIIGSAIFNMLVIIAISGLSVETPLSVDSGYFVRDVVFYLFTIVILILTNIDGKNTPWSMWVLTSSYFYYLAYLRYRLFFTSKDKNNVNVYQSKRTWSTLKMVLKAKNRFKGSITNKRFNSISEFDKEMDPRSPRNDTYVVIDITQVVPKRNCTIPKCKTSPLTIIYLFWNTLFSYTIPTNRFCLGFLMCCLWIIGITYILVWCCSVFSTVLGIPDIISGLLILAPTTSLPDAIASIVMARRGEGSSAISNAIGSNIFDIAIGHGLPHLVYTLIYGIQYTNITNIGIRSYSALGVSILITIISFLLSGWKLNKLIGGVLLTTYLIYVTIEIYLQLK